MLKSWVVDSHRKALFHCKLNAFWEHENIKSKIGLYLRPYTCKRSYFHQEPLFQGSKATIFKLGWQAFNDKLIFIKFSAIYISVNSIIFLLDMFRVLTLNVKYFDIYSKMPPLNMQKDKLFIYALFLDYYSEVFNKLFIIFNTFSLLYFFVNSLQHHLWFFNIVARFLSVFLCMRRIGRLYLLRNSLLWLL